MDSTHATPSFAIQGSPRRLGVLAGVLAGLVIGAGTMLGGLLLAGRIDLDAPGTRADAVSPMAGALYATHFQREHRAVTGGAGSDIGSSELAVPRSEDYRAHVQREYRSDVTPGAEATTRAHVQREYRLELAKDSSATMMEAGRRHFVREHRAEGR